MNGKVCAQVSLFVMLNLLVWGCRDTMNMLSHHAVHSNHAVHSKDGAVPVRVTIEGVGSGSRSIAPAHIPVADLADPAKYSLRLQGTSDMGGSVDRQNFPVRQDGLGILALTPGLWTLTLTATEAGTNNALVSGSTVFFVGNAPTSASITLTPLDGAGVVAVTFTLPQSVVTRLDGAQNSKTITVALLDTAGQEVANSRQTFTANAADATTTISYTANGSQPAGRYTLALTAPYTVNNASTNHQDVTYTLGYEDILYVEGNRLSSASISIHENIMGIPGRPVKIDKMGLNGSSSAVNFNGTTAFDPWGETLWTYRANWDGNDSDLFGNEVLVLGWDPVYDADFYEVEILMHPFSSYRHPPTQYGKFDTVVTTDAAWDALKAASFSTSGQTGRVPLYLRFSGAATDSDYYRTRIYKNFVVSNNDGTHDNSFWSCADKNLARTIFTTTQNLSYRVTSTRDAFDDYTQFINSQDGGGTLGKVGLEADCGIIGILVPSFAPQMSVVCRMRSVNKSGHSDWVYWKGGRF